MRKFKVFLLVLFIIPLSLLFSGCQVCYVTNIEKTADNVYTVTYSNGTKSTIVAKNGEDGADGEDLTMANIKAFCDENGLDFEEFLEAYLDVEYNSTKSATTKALKSAVSIWCEFPVTKSSSRDISVSCGAGIIYKMNTEYSYIVTNYHVVYYNSSNTSNHIASKIHLFQYGTSESVQKTNYTDSLGYPIYNYGDGAVECEYVGGSLNYDLAVLRVETSQLLENNKDACAVTIANTYTVADEAIAIGNPECEGISVTSGLVSVCSEEIDMTGADDSTKCQFRVMRIDTAINGGNSGGGLFNNKGELIGIVNAKIVDEEIDNIAYALPYDNITKVADNIIYYFEKTHTPSQVKRLYLNIGYLPENSTAVYLNDEVYITDDFIVKEVYAGGLGEEYGLEVNDIINNIKIKHSDNSTETYDIIRAYELAELFLTIRAGDTITLSGIRDDVNIEFCTFLVNANDLSIVK